MVDLFLYEGEPSDGDLRLRDPTAPSGSGGSGAVGFLLGPDWTGIAAVPSEPLAGFLLGPDWTGISAVAHPAAGFVLGPDWTGVSGVPAGGAACGFYGSVDWTGIPCAVPLVQYPGLRGRYGGVTYDLALVDAARAIPGASLFLRKNGVVYAVHLVRPTNPHASPFRVQTSLGTMAFRLLTT